MCVKHFEENASDGGDEKRKARNERTLEQLKSVLKSIEDRCTGLLQFLSFNSPSVDLSQSFIRNQDKDRKSESRTRRTVGSTQIENDSGELRLHLRLPHSDNVDLDPGYD